ncbi:MAG: hypothetical protein KGL39_38825 [Patescibacteria group bacterium]|nr:hypothetical protein [Patescibacteria group bacterium]
MEEAMETGLKDRYGHEIKIGHKVTVPYVDPLGGLHMDTDGGTYTVEFKHGAFGIEIEHRFRPLMKFCKLGKSEYIPNVGTVHELLPVTILRVEA